MIEEAIKKLAQRQNLGKEEAYASMDEIMSGKASESLIAGFLMGLRVKGETPEEIAGCTRAMREKAIRIQTKHTDVIDTCGTGGDASGTFNVSTAAAIIASAAGVPVAKHGNRAVSSACGSADVLKELGVNIEIEPEGMSKVLDAVGISFLFAPRLHGAMKYAAPVRKQLGVRTVFNILGPLTNPAGAKRQVLGVFSPELTGTIASVLKELGCEHALIVNGEGGIDEFSTLGKTTISELKGGEISGYTLHVGETGLAVGDRKAILGGDASMNASMIRHILDGSDGAPSDMAVLNAGAAIYVGGKAGTIREGVRIAKETQRSGLAKQKLSDWIQATNSL